MRVIVGLLVTAAVGALILGAVSMHRWSVRCERAGGHVVSHFEGYTTTFTYTYDAKGNVTSVSPVMTPDYSYTCEGLPAGVAV